MIDMLQTILGFIVTLGVLVSVHEYGHFWVARRVGVKVLRFSLGFGKAIYSWHDKHGTEFSIGMVPLGGYVKMLDEKEGIVQEEEKKFAFNTKPILSRVLVVLAGPVANFLLAIFALWAMYCIGMNVFIPRVGEVASGSLAAKAGMQLGDEIVSIGDMKTPDWRTINMRLLSYMGESGSIPIEVYPEGVTGNTKEYVLQIDNWLLGEDDPDFLKAIGIQPYVPSIPPVIGELVPGEVAETSGILIGDTIDRVNDKTVNSWDHWVELVRAHAGKEMLVDILRNNMIVSKTIIPSIRLEAGKKLGYIGAGVKQVTWPDTMFRMLRYGPLDGFVKSIEGVWFLTKATLESLWKIVSGLISSKNLGGVITIAKVVGSSLQVGIASFFYVLAMLSVSLGVLNLLPVPALDGGHLLYYLVEWVRGKPLSEKIQEIGLQIGVSIIVGVMIFAIYNDIMRFF